MLLEYGIFKFSEIFVSYVFFANSLLKLFLGNLSYVCDTWGHYVGKDGDVGLVDFEALKMETVRFFEMLASTYKSTQRHSPEVQHYILSCFR